MEARAHTCYLTHHIQDGHSATVIVSSTGVTRGQKSVSIAVRKSMQRRANRTAARALFLCLVASMHSVVNTSFASTPGNETVGCTQLDPSVRKGAFTAAEDAGKLSGLLLKPRGRFL